MHTICRSLQHDFYRSRHPNPKLIHFRYPRIFQVTTSEGKQNGNHEKSGCEQSCSVAKPAILHLHRGGLNLLATSSRSLSSANEGSSIVTSMDTEKYKTTDDDADLSVSQQNLSARQHFGSVDSSLVDDFNYQTSPSFHRSNSSDLMVMSPLKRVDSHRFGFHHGVSFRSAHPNTPTITPLYHRGESRFFDDAPYHAAFLDFNALPISLGELRGSEKKQSYKDITINVAITNLSSLRLSCALVIEENSSGKCLYSGLFLHSFRALSKASELNSEDLFVGDEILQVHEYRLSTATLSALDTEKTNDLHESFEHSRVPSFSRQLQENLAREIEAAISAQIQQISQFQKKCGAHRNLGTMNNVRDRFSSKRLIVYSTEDTKNGKMEAADENFHHHSHYEQHEKTDENVITTTDIGSTEPTQTIKVLVRRHRCITQRLQDLSDGDERNMDSDGMKGGELNDGTSRCIHYVIL